MSASKIVNSKLEKYFPWFCCVGFLLVFWALFTGRSPQIGHDYKYFLPRLVEGADYTLKNWGIQYFSRFCGGFPAYGNPQSMQLSVPQVFFFFLTPYAALVSSVLFYCFLGFWGMYWLLRRGLEISSIVAATGALVFISNGFFFSHLMAGHFSYITFPLIPWVLLFLVESDRAEKKRSQIIFLSCSVFIATSFLYSGGYWTSFVLGGGILYFFTFVKRIRVSLFLAFIFLSVLLGLSKLQAFLDFHPILYHDYQLQKSKDFVDALRSAGAALFLPPAWAGYKETEFWWEYSSLLCPLILLALLLKDEQGVKEKKLELTKKLFQILMLFGLVLIAGVWQEAIPFIKRIPFVSNYYILPRYSSFVILPLVLWFARKLERASRAGWGRFSIEFTERARGNWAFGTAIGCLVVFGFSYGEIVFFWPSSKHRVDFDSSNVSYLPLTQIIEFEAKSDPIAGGGALALRCYEAALGYKLEGDRRKIKLGPIGIPSEGYLNFTHPGCLLYPDVYFRERWSLVKEEEKEGLEKFLSNIDPEWPISGRQSLANAISLSTFLLLTIFIAIPLKNIKTHR